MSAYEHFKDLVEGSNYDIIALTETWLSGRIDSDSLLFGDYRLYRGDRDGRGGGVAFLVRGGVSCSVLETSDIIEQLWLSFKLHGVGYAVGVLYRPPHFNYKTFVDELESTVSDIAPTVDHLIVLGDFNIDMLCLNDARVIALSDVFDTFGLTQLINEPTRSTLNSSTLIDLLCVSDSVRVECSGTICAGHISDHDLVFCRFRVRGMARGLVCKAVRSFRNFCHASFLTDLYSIPFYNIFDLLNVNDKVQFLTDGILHTIDKHAPLRDCKFTRSPAPWITDTVREMQRLRDGAYKRFKARRTNGSWEYYRDLRNYVKSAIGRERKAYLVAQAVNGGRDAWTAWRRVGACKTSTSIIPENLCKPNEVNQYFIDSVPGLAGFVFDRELYTFYNNNRLTTAEFSFRDVSDFDVEKAVWSVKSNATGYDRLNVKIIKLCTPHVIPFIRDIINSSISVGRFPGLWKHAIVKPLPKSRTPANFSDLRPISVLPVLSKIAEKLLWSQLYEFVEKKQFITGHSVRFSIRV